MAEVISIMLQKKGHYTIMAFFLIKLNELFFSYQFNSQLKFVIYHLITYVREDTF